MSRPAIVTTIPPIGLGGRQPRFAEEADSGPRCDCGLSTGTGVLNAGCPILFDSANMSAKGASFQDRSPRSNAADVAATPSPLFR